jgi:hypothetical protein
LVAVRKTWEKDVNGRSYAEVAGRVELRQKGPSMSRVVAKRVPAGTAGMGESAMCTEGLSSGRGGHARIVAVVGAIPQYQKDIIRGGYVDASDPGQ